MATNEANRFEATLTALRGIVMIAAGVLAFLYPTEAVKFVLLAGGGLLLVDGVLGLLSSDFSGRHDTAFWLALIRNIFCIVAGLTVLASGVLTNVFTLGFLASFVGVLAILAGLVEIVSGLMDRERYSSATSAMVSGGLYVVFGLALLFVPLSSAATLIRVITILIILYALSLLYRAWRIRMAS